jgi:hypothetical protein
MLITFQILDKDLMQGMMNNCAFGLKPEGLCPEYERMLLMVFETEKGAWSCDLLELMRLVILDALSACIAKRRNISKGCSDSSKYAGFRGV